MNNFYKLVKMGDNEFVAKNGVSIMPLSKWHYADNASSCSRASVFAPSQRLVELRHGSITSYAVECREWCDGPDSGYEISYLIEPDSLRIMWGLSGYNHMGENWRYTDIDVDSEIYRRLVSLPAQFHHEEDGYSVSFVSAENFGMEWGKVQLSTGVMYFVREN